MISIQLFGWENELERKKKDFISYVKKQTTFCDSPPHVIKKRKIPTVDPAACLIGCYLRAKNNQSKQPVHGFLISCVIVADFLGSN